MTREEAKEIMLKLLSEITKDFDVLEDDEREAFNMAIKALEQEQKTGHWIDIDSKDEWYGQEVKCSLCGSIMMSGGNFCHSCGARMKGYQIGDTVYDEWKGEL